MPLSLSILLREQTALSTDGFENLLPLILRFFGGDTSREVCARSRGRDNDAPPVAASSYRDVLEFLERIIYNGNFERTAPLSKRSVRAAHCLYCRARVNCSFLVEARVRQINMLNKLYA